MPSVRIMTSGWSGNNSALERLKKGRGEYITQKNFDTILEAKSAPKYHLRRVWDGVLVDGEYTIEEVLKKLGNGKMLALYKMEPVKP